jgi:hypothetical protein
VKRKPCKNRKLQAVLLRDAWYRSDESIADKKRSKEMAVDTSWAARNQPCVEIEDLIERSVILSTSDVLNGPLPDLTYTPKSSAPITLEEVEHSYK